jgi:hypothetical protein
LVVVSKEMAEIKQGLAVFGERPTAVTDAETRAARRERIVARIGEVLGEPRGIRRPGARRRWVYVTGGLALAAGAAGLLSREAAAPVPTQTAPDALHSVALRGPVLCQTGGGEWATCHTEAILPGASLKTLEKAAASLETEAGVRLELGADATLLLTDIGPSRPKTRVTLREGRLSVRVPPLVAGAQFSVVTPTATVTVHGTAFTVEVDEGTEEPSRTCVRVTEGTVSVRHAVGEQRVSAGGSWGCDRRARAESPRSESPPAASSRGTSRQTASAARGSSSMTSSAERSTLAVEAQLLQTALGAERRGELALAEKTLVSLLAAFPNSVVAPEARAALDRVRRRQPAR